MPDKDNFEHIIEGEKKRYIVRRLTPLECQRLQGMPDWWFDGVDGSDSAKYKAMGNAIAMPCAQEIFARIVDAYECGR